MGYSKWMYRFFKPSGIITLLEYMKIWCNIQVITYLYFSRNPISISAEQTSLVKIFSANSFRRNANHKMVDNLLIHTKNAGRVKIPRFLQ